jgi:uncharacterized protein YaaW (UPF0174 family)
MKLTIEINDDTLKNAIQQQLDAAVAQVTESLIQDRVKAVVGTKLERVSDERIQEAFEKAATRLLTQGLGGAQCTQHTLSLRVNAIMAEAARKLIKGLA